MHITTLF